MHRLGVSLDRDPSGVSFEAGEFLVSFLGFLEGCVMDASSAQPVHGIVAALTMALLGILGFGVAELSARRHRRRLEAAKISYETVLVKENLAPDGRMYRPSIFIPPVGLGPAVAFVDERSGRYHNVIITPEYPHFPIVFDSETRVLPGSHLSVVVRRDRLTDEVIHIQPEVLPRDQVLQVP